MIPEAGPNDSPGGDRTQSTIGGRGASHYLHCTSELSNNAVAHAATNLAELSRKDQLGRIVTHAGKVSGTT
jgi:hypothetical protein